MKKCILLCLALSVHTVLYSTNTDLRIKNDTHHDIGVLLENNTGTKVLLKRTIEAGLELILIDHISDMKLKYVQKAQQSPKPGLRITITHMGGQGENKTPILLKQFLIYPFPKGAKTCSIYYNNKGKIAVRFIL